MALAKLRVSGMRAVLTRPFLAYVFSPGVSDQHLKVSRNCIFPPRVEILFGNFGD
jgi:hypothetical protein